MFTKRIGSMKVGEIGIGTWKMLGEDDEYAAIRESLGKGINLIDTAEMYGNEEFVGRAITGTKMFVATKASPNHFKHDSLVRAGKSSRSRLKRKSIDLYQLHWPSRSIPIRETISAMEELADSGVVKNIGVSNFSLAELEEAVSSAERHRIVSNQVEHSILFTEAADEIRDYCKANRITIIAYSPLARGEIFRDRKLFNLLQTIGESHEKSVPQVALNWLVSDPNVVAIPKASDPAHVIENAGASGWRLSKSEIREISRHSGGKMPIAKFMKPLIRLGGAGFVDVYGRLNSMKASAQRKRSTTKSSKK